MWIAIAIILIILILFLLALSGRGGKKRFQGLEGFDYAHRGLYKTGEIPENSTAAFALAIRQGYGIELDLHLLADGELAVIHDDTLSRTTGLEGKVKELTADKLCECCLEGTKWTIPTFKEVLQQVDGQVPLIIELKSEGNTEALCKAVVKALRGYRGAYCIESFDPRVVFWFRKNRPEITRGQLSKNFIKEPTEHKFPVRFILTTLLCNFLTNPDFIAYNFAHRNDLCNVIATRLWKLQPVSWTINNKRDGVKAKKEGSIIIFENYLP